MFNLTIFNVFSYVAQRSVDLVHQSRLFKCNVQLHLTGQAQAKANWS